MTRAVLARLAAALVLAVALAGGGSDRTLRAEPAVELAFAELYKDASGVAFSDKVLALAGKQVLVRGYMAPPLSAGGNFFVLTKEPVQKCPYCETDADWPRDILVVYLNEGRYSATARLKIAGVLEVGSKTDERTGFVSQLRLVDAEVVR